MHTSQFRDVLESDRALITGAARFFDGFHLLCCANDKLDLPLEVIVTVKREFPRFACN